MADFYKEKNMFRQTVILSAEGKKTLTQLAKENHVPQGIAVEVAVSLLCLVDPEVARNTFRDARARKVDTRKKRTDFDTDLLNRVKALPPEKLAAILNSPI